MMRRLAMWFFKKYLQPEVHRNIIGCITADAYDDTLYAYWQAKGEFLPTVPRDRAIKAIRILSADMEQAINKYFIEELR